MITRLTSDIVGNHYNKANITYFGHLWQLGLLTWKCWQGISIAMFETRTMLHLKVILRLDFQPPTCSNLSLWILKAPSPLKCTVISTDNKGSAPQVRFEMLYHPRTRANISRRVVQYCLSGLVSTQLAYAIIHLSLCWSALYQFHPACISVQHELCMEVRKWEYWMRDQICF